MENKHKNLTKLTAIVAIALLMLTAFTLLLIPTESANSSFRMQLQSGEQSIKRVGAAPDSVDFMLEIYDTGSDANTHEITLSIVNVTYSGGSSAASWAFSFPDADAGGDTYYVAPSATEPVTLRVEFSGASLDEMVRFTVVGLESEVTDPTPDGNHTYLTPYDCTSGNIQYLSVVSSSDYFPFWERAPCSDDDCNSLPCDEIILTIWNLGSLADDVGITSVEVYLDVNEDGVIDGGDTLSTSYFTISFEYLGGGAYVVGSYISLGSGESEYLRMNIYSDFDDAPDGYYLFEITVSSIGDSSTFTDTFESYVKGHPEVCASMITFGPGWNVISIPVGLDSLGGAYTASVLAAEINAQAGDNIINYIVRYNEGEFQEYIVEAGIGENFPIELGVGYYVFSASPFSVDFAIAGDCLEGCSKTTMDACWNLIGWSSRIDTMYVGEYADMVDAHAGGQAVQAIIYYDTASETYITWYPVVDSDTKFLMEPGRGYWIFVATDLTDVPYP